MTGSEVREGLFGCNYLQGLLVAYELTDPDNWDTAEAWTKRVIKGDFLLFGSYSKGSQTPGKHRLFYPSK